MGRRRKTVMNPPPSSSHVNQILGEDEITNATSTTKQSTEKLGKEITKLQGILAETVGGSLDRTSDIEMSAESEYNLDSSESQDTHPQPSNTGNPDAQDDAHEGEEVVTQTEVEETENNDDELNPEGESNVEDDHLTEKDEVTNQDAGESRDEAQDKVFNPLFLIEKQWRAKMDYIDGGVDVSSAQVKEHACFFWMKGIISPEHYHNIMQEHEATNQKLLEVSEIIRDERESPSKTQKELEDLINAGVVLRSRYNTNYVRVEAYEELGTQFNLTLPDDINKLYDMCKKDAHIRFEKMKEENARLSLAASEERKAIQEIPKRMNPLYSQVLARQQVPQQGSKTPLLANPPLRGTTIQQQGELAISNYPSLGSMYQALGRPTLAQNPSPVWVDKNIHVLEDSPGHVSVNYQIGEHKSQVTIPMEHPDVARIGTMTKTATYQNMRLPEAVRGQMSGSEHQLFHTLQQSVIAQKNSERRGQLMKTGMSGPEYMIDSFGTRVPAISFTPATESCQESTQQEENQEIQNFDPSEYAASIQGLGQQKILSRPALQSQVTEVSGRIPSSFQPALDGSAGPRVQGVLNQPQKVSQKTEERKMEIADNQSKNPTSRSEKPPVTYDDLLAVITQGEKSSGEISKCVELVTSLKSHHELLWTKHEILEKLIEGLSARCDHQDEVISNLLNVLNMKTSQQINEAPFSIPSAPVQEQYIQHQDQEARQQEQAVTPGDAAQIRFNEWKLGQGHPREIHVHQQIEGEYRQSKGNKDVDGDQYSKKFLQSPVPQRMILLKSLFGGLSKSDYQSAAYRDTFQEACAYLESQ